ncbi:metallo-beta-lactamase YycJ [Enterococcus sp. DIV0213j]|jgi:phosphoribosyl 1,2-cyclic phosphodiesterase|nr:metallo-beta-lactamase domain protein [Enterococcus faecalis 13-SD-W-01]
MLNDVRREVLVTMAEENAAFKISILASGSSGNSLYIETGKKKLLVDAGLSGKKITSLMAQIDRTPDQLDGILVTHEHRDHIHGVGVLARKYKLDVYANEKTWEAMDTMIGNVPVEQKHLFEMGKVQTFGDLDIESFGVSHDAAAPQFYRFYKDNRSFVMLTDTGYCSDYMRGTIKNADGYLMESNHDLEMLRMGPYPWNLKQRILGDRGHLSNEDGALVMTDVIGDRTKRIYLGHLSRENNLKELAHLTMENVLREKDKGVGEAFEVYDTDPDEATELFSI